MIAKVLYRKGREEKEIDVECSENDSYIVIINKAKKAVLKKDGFSLPINYSRWTIISKVK